MRWLPSHLAQCVLINIFPPVIQLGVWIGCYTFESPMLIYWCNSCFCLNKDHFYIQVAPGERTSREWLTLRSWGVVRLPYTKFIIGNVFIMAYLKLYIDAYFNWAVGGVIRFDTLCIFLWPSGKKWWLTNLWWLIKELDHEKFHPDHSIYAG